jgi:putative NADH-flavin reductase
MNITIFGANGGIGKIAVDLAVKNGHKVTAVIRHAAKADNTVKDNCITLYFDLSEQEKIEQAVSETDIVISAIGPKMDMSRKIKGTPVADGLKNIIIAMNKLNKKRLIIFGTPTLPSKKDKKNITTVIPNFMAKALFPNAYQEMKKMSEILYSSNVDWTVVRFINPNLKKNGNGYEYVMGDKRGKFGISRYNIASFIINESIQDKFINEMPIIFNK